MEQLLKTLNSKYKLDFFTQLFKKSNILNDSNNAIYQFIQKSNIKDPIVFKTIEKKLGEEFVYFDALFGDIFKYINKDIYDVGNIVKHDNRISFVYNNVGLDVQLFNNRSVENKLFTDTVHVCYKLNTNLLKRELDSIKYPFIMLITNKEIPYLESSMNNILFINIYKAYHLLDVLDTINIYGEDSYINIDYFSIENRKSRYLLTTTEFIMYLLLKMKHDNVSDEEINKYIENAKKI